jgi:hypothetical protein
MDQRRVAGALSDRFEESPFAPLIVIAVSSSAAFSVMPVTMLIAATGIVFRPMARHALFRWWARRSARYLSTASARGRARRGAAGRRADGSTISPAAIAKRGLLAMPVRAHRCRSALFRIINLVAAHRTWAFATFCSARSWVCYGYDSHQLVCRSHRRGGAAPGPVTFALLALVAGVAIGGTLAVRARAQAERCCDASGSGRTGRAN